MVDPTPYLEPRIAPRAIFDSLPERASRARFEVWDGQGWRTVTWQEHADQVRHVALFLGERLEPGERAGIFAPNRVEWMAAALGVQAAGGVMVPIYASSTVEQTAYIVEHSGARALFVDTVALLRRVFEAWGRLQEVQTIVLFDDAIDVSSVLREMQLDGVAGPSLEEAQARIATWSQVMREGARRDAEQPGAFEQTMDAVSLTQPGLMLYTSGTSGPPKGVPLTHENVAVNGADWMRCLSTLVEEGDVDLLWLPMSHIFGFGEACLGNTLGWTSYLSEPRKVLEDLPRVSPHVFMSVPALWEKLSITSDGSCEKLRELTGPNLRFCLSGGAGLKREVKEHFHDAGLLIIEGYGLTEASPTLTLNRPDAFRFDTVGQVLPSVELRLAEDGEILARGKSIFGGYHRDPEASAAAFTDDGWFKTGDVGRWSEGGFLQIVDRKKDIFVTAGGKNIAPANIEVRFRDDPFITHLVVYGDGEKFLTAGVWLDEGAVLEHAPGDEAQRALVQERIDGVNAELARHETIKKFVIVDEPLTIEGGMLTPTLKPKRKKIIERHKARFQSLYA